MSRYLLSSLALIFSFNLGPAAYAEAPPKTATAHAVAAKGHYWTPPPFVGERFARTELFFGTARPAGLPPVSDAEFQDFLDNEITPAFPDGLTLLKGLGQFRGADGVAIEEDSFVVILLYPADAKRENSGKIEDIREEYKARFQQESVLRSDTCCQKVGF